MNNLFNFIDKIQFKSLGEIMKHYEDMTEEEKKRI